MICYPHAKINIGLYVTSRREDGYHNIESVMYPVGMCDILEIIENIGEKEDRFRTTGIVLDTSPRDNLCLKAIRLLREDFGFPAVSVHLHKMIPAGAGLGGGSSDAAFCLQAIDAIFQLGLSKQQMSHYALELGSDCPFFLSKKAVFASGRGEELKGIDLDINAYYLIVVSPEFSVSTRDAYAHIRPHPAGYALSDFLLSTPPMKWKGVVSNQFEEYVCKQHAQIRSIINRLYGAGALFASLSGSGSSVFGLFSAKPQHPLFFKRCAVWEGQPGLDQ